MTSGRIRSHSIVGLTHSAATASKARLVFASATIRPNWIISGSFRNCGAPPDRVITVAIVTELMIVAADVARKAASHSRSPGTPSRGTSAATIVYDTTAIRAKLARLNATLIGRCPEANSIAAADPVRTARTYSDGDRKNRPMTAGNSLRENEWVSRRKWTSTTFSSAAAKAAARIGHGMWMMALGAGRPWSCVA